MKFHAVVKRKALPRSSPNVPEWQHDFKRQLGLFGPRVTFVELISFETVLFLYRMFIEKLSLHNIKQA